MVASQPAEVASQFVEAFAAADVERMRALLAEDLVAYVTNAEGGQGRGCADLNPEAAARSVR